MPSCCWSQLPFWTFVFALSLSAVPVSAASNTSTTTTTSVNPTAISCNVTINGTDECVTNNTENTTSTVATTIATEPTTNNFNSTVAQTNVTSVAANATSATTAQSITSTTSSTTTISPTTTTPEVNETTTTTTTTTTTAVTTAPKTTTKPTTTVSTTPAPVQTTTQPPSTTTQNSTVDDTTPTAKQTIAEYVKAKWTEVVTQSGFNNTLLNGTNLTIIDVVVANYKSMNDSQLQNILGPNRVDEVAKTILDQESDLLEPEIRSRFNASQNSSLYASFAALYWLRDYVLARNGERFSLLLKLYDQPSRNATEEGLALFILANASSNELLESLCKVVEEENLEKGACPTAETPSTTAAPLPGPEKLESTWEAVIAVNRSYLTSAQNKQLQAITPENLTTGLIAYVSDLDSEEIKQMVESNTTKYISSLLRKNGDASETLGQEASDAFANDEDKQDVFYLYLNFINSLFSASEKFDVILKGYVGSSPNANRTRRATVACDTSTINAKGLCCYTINEEANNLTALRDAICEELNGGQDCLITFTVLGEENPTSEPVPPQGLSIGAIVGIVIGSVVGVVLLVILIFFLWKRSNKKKRKVNPQNGDTRSENDHAEVSSTGEP